MNVCRLPLCAVCMYVKRSPLRYCPWKGATDWSKGKGPQLDPLANPASKISSRHTADCVQPLISGFGGQLCSRPIGFAKRLYIRQIGYTQALKSLCAVSIERDNISRSLGRGLSTDSNSRDRASKLR